MASSATAIRHSADDSDLTEKSCSALPHEVMSDIMDLSATDADPPNITNADEPPVIMSLQVDTYDINAKTHLEVELSGSRSQLIHSLGTTISLLQRLDKTPLRATSSDKPEADELPVTLQMQVDTSNSELKIDLWIDLSGSRSQLISTLGIIISLLQKLDKTTLNATTTDHPGATNVDESPVAMRLQVDTVNRVAKIQLGVDLRGSRSQLISSLGIIISLLQKLNKTAVNFAAIDQSGVTNADESPDTMSLRVDTNDSIAQTHLGLNLYSSRNQLISSLGTIISLLQKLDKKESLILFRGESCADLVLETAPTLRGLSLAPVNVRDAREYF